MTILLSVNKIMPFLGENSSMCSTINSNIAFKENTTVNYTSNFARMNGGAIRCSNHSKISCEGRSEVYLTHKNALDWGGAIFANVQVIVLFSHYSNVYYHDTNNLA